MSQEVVINLVSLVVGLVGGLIGAYVGMKVGLARLETWMGIAKIDIDRIQEKVDVYGEDLLVHDMEIGQLMRAGNFPRVSRQRMRGQ